MLKSNIPYLGFGLGLRAPHYASLIANLPSIDWLEILSENYFIEDGKAFHNLEFLRHHYPIAMHGVSMSLGSVNGLNKNYLKKLKSLADKIQPQWISDHVSWSEYKGEYFHDLLPMPFNEESLNLLCAHITYVQEYLQRPILVENISSYLTYHESNLPEWEFLATLAKKTGCFILLDINNIFVNAFNHHFDPYHYIDHIPASLVKQVHLGGHTRNGHHIIDTHDSAVDSAVWDLYAYTIQKMGALSTLIERDENIPELSVLLSEVNKAKLIANAILNKEDHYAH